MAVSKDAVIFGFRFFLGREPESEQTIKAHMGAQSETALAETLIRSGEFSRSKRFDNLIELKVLPASKTTGTGLPALKILIIGNCQIKGVARLIQAMVGNVVTTTIEALPATTDRLKSGDLDISLLVSQSDLILLHPHAEIPKIFEEKFVDARGKTKLFPRVAFSAFHPDVDYISNRQNSRIKGPLGEYQSTIAFYGWANDYSVEETIGLYNEDVFEKLGFFDYWNACQESLIQEGKATGLPLEHLIDQWSRTGEWMHSSNHPKLFVLADVARAILAREGITALLNVEQFVDDDLAQGPVWPLYPEIGRKLNVTGHYQFKKARGSCPQDQPVLMLGLAEFVRDSFESFSKYSKEDLVCTRLASSRYQELGNFLKKRQIPNFAKIAAPTVSQPDASRIGRNPYQGLPDHQFWRRAIERLPMQDVDPVVRSSMILNREHKVATAGSCFAQHISRTLQKNGFNYYISEGGDDLPSEEAQRRNFGVFSARYGNLYTARQLVQLFDRAYGIFIPTEQYWIRGDGRFADPFRPQIEPDGFASVEELERSRVAHFSSVRKMFENLDVLVFTLGLTEAWRCRSDGAVYPLAPGVVAGELNPDVHEFVNFGVADVVADMNAFVERLLRVNPHARMLVTVSPVPLIATYEDRHVLVSTTYSKAVLRAAAEEVSQRNPMCEYFPSYEIVTGHYTKGEYFETDLRSVKPEGVDHVMRLFMSHYSSGKTIHEKAASALDEELMRESVLMNEVICDEEAIDTAR